ncbi:MAG: hypothetical protein NVV73_00610 [Cellvibrionaceae bacterium]|nr:hypothetical protein [Cellvibrionaceae bacterium]
MMGRFVMVCVAAVVCSCASSPQNKVGSAYDADSFYCLYTEQESGSRYCESTNALRARASASQSNRAEAKSVFLYFIKRLL